MPAPARRVPATRTPPAWPAAFCAAGSWLSASRIKGGNTVRNSCAFKPIFLPQMLDVVLESRWVKKHFISFRVNHSSFRCYEFLLIKRQVFNLLPSGESTNLGHYRFAYLVVSFRMEQLENVLTSSMTRCQLVPFYNATAPQS